MLGGLLLVPFLSAAAQVEEAAARWRCEPAAVEVGQPFDLVLELVHAPETSPGGLLQGEPAFDDTWVVLERRPARTLERGERSLTSAITWSVASLEPGQRDLGAALAAVSLAQEVKTIQVGGALIAVRGVLAPGEEAPRPLREFPERFGTPGETSTGRAGLLAALGVALITLLAVFVAWRVRRTRGAHFAPALSPLDRLGELERRSEPEGSPSQATQRTRDGCYELTRLLRETTDRARSKNRSGLTDDEWLAELRASLEVPVPAVDELGAVFERAERVKYGGQPTTTWALKETFARARSALQSLGASAASGGAP